MAESTGLILAAGAFAMGDLILNDGWDPKVGVPLLVATVGAAYISAGLDKVLPGFGTGVAVVLLVSALLGNAPKLAEKLFPQSAGTTVGEAAPLAAVAAQIRN